MKTLQIEESKARSIYKTASPELKIMLEDTFGKEFFFQKITDRIKTYEDACEKLGIVPVNESVLLRNGYTKDMIAYQKIKTIVKALNEGWEPNWDDKNQKKWVPWFCLHSTSGFIFNGTDYYFSSAYAGFELRLCFKSDELATYAGKQFVELYKEFIL